MTEQEKELIEVDLKGFEIIKSWLDEQFENYCAKKQVVIDMELAQKIGHEDAEKVIALFAPCWIADYHPMADAISKNIKVLTIKLHPHPNNRLFRNKTPSLSDGENELVKKAEVVYLKNKF